MLDIAFASVVQLIDIVACRCDQGLSLFLRGQCRLLQLLNRATNGSTDGLSTIQCHAHGFRQFVRCRCACVFDDFSLTCQVIRRLA